MDNEELARKLKEIEIPKSGPVMPSEVRYKRPRERYPSVGDYDPVLRAHCRLDSEV